MAGAYLEISPQQTYTFTSNVLLNNVAVELYLSTLWFTAARDTAIDPFNNTTPFINLVSTSGSNVTISNNNTSVNSVITVTLTKELTANLSFVNAGFWALTAKTAAGAVYGLDNGRIAVVPRVGVAFF